AGKERAAGRVRIPVQGSRRLQPASPTDRKAAGCTGVDCPRQSTAMSGGHGDLRHPLPPGGVVASVTMNLHRSLLTPCQATNANPSRPPPVVSSDPWFHLGGEHGIGGPCPSMPRKLFCVGMLWISGACRGGRRRARARTPIA